MPRRQLVALFTAISLVALGCGGAAEPPTRPAAPRHAVRAPAYEWVSFYGGLPPRAILSEEQSAAAARITGSPDAPICPTLEQRLVHAATASASELANSPEWRPREHTDRLRFHLQRFGTTDYSVDSIVGQLDAPGEARLQEFVSRRSPDWSHCGLGIADGREGKVAVVIGVRRQVEINPLAVRVGTHNPVELLGRLPLPGGADAPLQALLGGPDGAVTTARVRRLGRGAFRALFTTAGAGRYQVELLADMGNGAETVLLLPLYAGAEPPRRPVIPGDAAFDLSTGEPATALLDLLNAKRAQLGVRQLAPCRTLQAEALKHSTDMAEDNFFGHVSPTRGSLGKRLKRSKIRSKKAAENIARSHSILRIHHNLMQSPSHRLNALDPEMTHVGIGVTRAADGYIATEIFARW